MPTKWVPGERTWIGLVFLIYKWASNRKSCNCPLILVTKCQMKKKTQKTLRARRKHIFLHHRIDRKSKFMLVLGCLNVKRINNVGISFFIRYGSYQIISKWFCFCLQRCWAKMQQYWHECSGKKYFIYPLSQIWYRSSTFRHFFVWGAFYSTLCCLINTTKGSKEKCTNLVIDLSLF